MTIHIPDQTFVSSIVGMAVSLSKIGWSLRYMRKGEFALEGPYHRKSDAMDIIWRHIT